MTKKLIIILIVISLAVAVAWVGFLIVSGPQIFEPADEGEDGFREFPYLGAPGQPGAPEEPAPPAPETDVPQETPMGLGEVVLPKLRQITRNPVAGVIALEKERTITETGEDGSEKEKKEVVTAVRWAERATGHIFEAFADQTEYKRLSNTTIPSVQEAFFGNNGESAVLRYVGTDGQSVESFSGTLPKEIEGGDSVLELKGGFLPANSQSFGVSPNTLKMFYMYPFGDGVVGVTSDLSGAKKTQVFDSSFTEWTARWASTRLITLQTKPSWGVPGYLYALDIQTKTVSRILGDIHGLTALMSPNGNLVFYSGATKNGLAVAARDLGKNQNTALSLITLPEKCLWLANGVELYCAAPVTLPAGKYPDDWYKGLVSFEDAIWKVNLRTQIFDLLSSPLQEAGAGIDAVNMTLSPDGDYLFFINKRDFSLWSLRI